MGEMRGRRTEARKVSEMRGRRSKAREAGEMRDEARDGGLTFFKYDALELPSWSLS